MTGVTGSAKSLPCSSPITHCTIRCNQRRICEAGHGVDVRGLSEDPLGGYKITGAAVLVPAGQLTVAAVDPHGKLSVKARVPTRAGARNPAVTDQGVVYLAHSSVGGLRDLVVVTPSK